VSNSGTSFHKYAENDDDDNNSILYLFACLLNSQKANYKIGMSKDEKNINTNDKITMQRVSFRQQ
jgi:hypothetical protein